MRSALLLCLALGASLPAPGANGGCIDFKWDVGAERALFATPARVMDAGTDAANAPALLPNHLYELRLKLRPAVRFAAPPGQNAKASWGNAGLASFRVPTAGSWRLVLELPLWVDVAADGALLAPYDYQSQLECSAPHKIVTFELPVRPVFLQLSGTDASTVRIAITPAPARLR